MFDNRTKLLPLLTGALAVAMLGCRQPPAHQRLRVQTDQWRFGKTTGHRLLTDHYSIYTTVSDAATLQALPVFMETAHRRYASLLPPRNTSDRQMDCYLFATRAQWERFTRGFTGDQARVYLRIRAGAYTQGDTCVGYYIRRSVTLAVLAHEGMHQYINRHFGRQVPAWLNEGLATYCENYDWVGDQPTFAPHTNRFRINNLREALVAGHLLPIDELLDIHAGHVLDSSRTVTVQSYYAQVWSVAMFLRHGPVKAYRTGFKHLLADLGTPALAAAARAQTAATSDRRLSFGQAVFRHYITEDLETFTRLHLTYARHLSHLD